MPKVPKVGDCYGQAQGVMRPIEVLDRGNGGAWNSEILDGFVMWLAGEDGKQRVQHTR